MKPWLVSLALVYFRIFSVLSRALVKTLLNQSMLLILLSTT